MAEDDKCPNTSVQNSIAAGVFHGGFIALGHDCGDKTSIRFRNNVAHSINGTGAFFLPDLTSKSGESCLEGSYFAAYNNAGSPVATTSKI